LEPIAGKFTNKDDLLYTRENRRRGGVMAEVKSKGSWWQRFVIRLFTIFFAILIYWFLGFLMEDIESLPGPVFKDIEESIVKPGLVEQEKSLDHEISAISHQIDNQVEKQKNLTDSSKNLQQTMNQLLELHKLGVGKGVEVSAAEQTNFDAALNLFLESQRSYQESNQAISSLIAKKQQFVSDREQVEQQIAKGREKAHEKYDQLSEQHLLYLAFVQLAILLPIFLLAIFFLKKMRSSIYFPIFLAFSAAAGLKVVFVIQDYFPSKAIKYVFIAALLLVVSGLLVRLIRAVAFPNPQRLAKQHREGYERFLCPVCEYPIRTGPRKFLFWTRRTVNKLILPTDRNEQEESYCCPACGTSLFEQCRVCQKIRHSLLPFCIHCSSAVESQSEAAGD
jgi:hypothetical protein